jgi:hypothetical protein
MKPRPRARLSTKITVEGIRNFFVYAIHHCRDVYVTSSRSASKYKFRYRLNTILTCPEISIPPSLITLHSHNEQLNRSNIPALILLRHRMLRVIRRSTAQRCRPQVIQAEGENAKCARFRGEFAGQSADGLLFSFTRTV